jgi:hypothetical protein
VLRFHLRLIEPDGREEKSEKEKEKERGKKRLPCGNWGGRKAQSFQGPSGGGYIKESR